MGYEISHPRKNADGTNADGTRALAVHSEVLKYSLTTCPPFSISLSKMFTDVGHELEDAQSEPDPLIQHNAKVPTTKEARTARAQFLALCWSLFMIGWTDGSTGPLLPRIQKFYDVSRPIVLTIFLTSPEFCRSGLEQCPVYLFCKPRSVMFIVRCRGDYFTLF